LTLQPIKNKYPQPKNLSYQNQRKMSKNKKVYYLKDNGEFITEPKFELIQWSWKWIDGIYLCKRYTPAMLDLVDKYYFSN
jgi:hypothetical protein